MLQIKSCSDIKSLNNSVSTEMFFCACVPEIVVFCQIFFWFVAVLQYFCGVDVQLSIYLAVGGSSGGGVGVSVQSGAPLQFHLAGHALLHWKYLHSSFWILTCSNWLGFDFSVLNYWENIWKKTRHCSYQYVNMFYIDIIKTCHDTT